jgi:hypothetical protein
MGALGASRGAVPCFCADDRRHVQNSPVGNDWGEL